MFDFIWNLGSFIVAIGLLVTVHEYGHFWVARRNGVKVLRFSIGFGKVLFSRFDKQGTEFVIAAIPLGGYVKMVDERVDDVPADLKAQAFNNKTVLQRMAIIFAGPAANFIFAVILMWLMFMIGQTEPKPIVGAVDSGSIMAQAGIEPGMEIVSINGQKTRDWHGVSLALAPTIGNASITIETVERNTKQHKTHELNIAGTNLDQPEKGIFHALGLRPYRPQATTTIAAITADSAAEKSGLKVADKIIKIDQLEQPTWQQMVDIIQQNGGNEILFEVLREGQKQSIAVTPSKTEVDGVIRGFIGISPLAYGWQQDDLVLIQYGPIEAFGQGIKSTGELIKLSFVMLGKLLTADVSVRNLSGPISIAQGAGDSANAGFVKFLWFLALISVNLGVINLLPLPVLDGGHLFYYAIELIRGKAVSERTQQIGLTFGVIVLFLLMGIALLNDISRLS